MEKKFFKLFLNPIFYGGHWDDLGWTDLKDCKAGLRYWVLNEAVEKYKVPKSIL